MTTTTTEASALTPAPDSPNSALNPAEVRTRASLALSAMDWAKNPVLLARGLDCYKHLLGRSYAKGARGFAHLPFYLVLDLMALVMYGDRAPFLGTSDGSQGSQGPGTTLLREARPVAARVCASYEGGFLNALLQERCFIVARERAAAGGPMTSSVAFRLVELVLIQLAHHYPTHPHHEARLAPARLRSFFFAEDGSEQAGLSALLANQELRLWDELTEELRSFMQAALAEVHWRELLSEGDHFELENWAVLDTEAKRIGVRQIGETERLLAETRLPRITVRDDRQEVETAFDDDTTYPTGGLAGLTTRGTMDNLVRSELVYISEGAGPVDASGAGPTLFDLRFAENELLYYLRNDGVMRRRRRTLHVIFDLADLRPGVSAWNHKSPELPYAFCTLAQGMAARTVRDLLAAFDADAVRVVVHYVTSAEGPALASVREEAALMGLVFGAEIRQGRLEVVFHAAFDPFDLSSPDKGSGRAYALAFTFQEERRAAWKEAFEELLDRKPSVRGYVVGCGTTANPSEEEESSAASDLTVPMTGLPWADLGLLKNALFSGVLTGRT